MSERFESMGTINGAIKIFPFPFSERELTFTFAICCRPSVCLSVTLVHPTQAIQIFGNISTALGTLAISIDIH